MTAAHEQRHLEAVTTYSVQQQSGMLSLVKKICNEIDDVVTVFLLGELSARTKTGLPAMAS